MVIPRAVVGKCKGLTFLSQRGVKQASYIVPPDGKFELKYVSFALHLEYCVSIEPKPAG